MPGNLSKAKALQWLQQYGAIVRCYPQEAAAAYLGLGVKCFRHEVAASRLPQPTRRGKRLVWDKAALDRHLDKENGAVPNGPEGQDPIMASIHAAQATTLRSGDLG
jgi:hypothetical protein